MLRANFLENLSQKMYKDMFLNRILDTALKLMSDRMSPSGLTYDFIDWLENYCPIKITQNDIFKFPLEIHDKYPHQQMFEGNLLMMAAFYKNYKLCDYLIDNNWNPNFNYSNHLYISENALTMAAGGSIDGYPDYLFESLMDRGVQLNDQQAQLCLIRAMLNNNTSVIDTIIKKKNILPKGYIANYKIITLEVDKYETKDDLFRNVNYLAHNLLMIQPGTILIENPEEALKIKKQLNNNITITPLWTFIDSKWILNEVLKYDKDNTLVHPLDFKISDINNLWKKYKTNILLDILVRYKITFTMDELLQSKLLSNILQFKEAVDATISIKTNAKQITDEEKKYFNKHDYYYLLKMHRLDEERIYEELNINTLKLYQNKIHQWIQQNAAEIPNCILYKFFNQPFNQEYYNTDKGFNEMLNWIRYFIINDQIEIAEQIAKVFPKENYNFRIQDDWGNKYMVSIINNQLRIDSDEFSFQSELRPLIQSIKNLFESND